MALTPLQAAYKKQEGCLFFNKIPLEIRNKIYEYLLIADGAISPMQQMATSDYNDYLLFPFHSETLEMHATIVRTCHLSVYETYPILYGQNTFVFCYPINIAKFQVDVGARDLDKGQDLEVPHQPKKDRNFGTNLVAGHAGRLSFIRQVYLLNEVFSQRTARVPAIEQCWKELGKFPALEHVILNFGHHQGGSDDEPCWASDEEKGFCSRQELAHELGKFERMVKRTLNERQLPKLRKLTIRGLQDESFPMRDQGWSFIGGLRKHTEPRIELIVDLEKPANASIAVQDQWVKEATFLLGRARRNVAHGSRLPARVKRLKRSLLSEVVTNLRSLHV